MVFHAIANWNSGCGKPGLKRSRSLASASVVGDLWSLPECAAPKAPREAEVAIRLRAKFNETHPVDPFREAGVDAYMIMRIAGRSSTTVSQLGTLAVNATFPSVHNALN
jgi:hypothetical protein